MVEQYARGSVPAGYQSSSLALSCTFQDHLRLLSKSEHCWQHSKFISYVSGNSSSAYLVGIIRHSHIFLIDRCVWFVQKKMQMNVEIPITCKTHYLHAWKQLQSAPLLRTSFPLIPSSCFFLKYLILGWTEISYTHAGLLQQSETDKNGKGSGVHRSGGCLSRKCLIWQSGFFFPWEEVVFSQTVIAHWGVLGGSDLLVYCECAKTWGSCFAGAPFNLFSAVQGYNFTQCVDVKCDMVRTFVRSFRYNIGNSCLL